MLFEVYSCQPSETSKEAELKKLGNLTKKLQSFWTTEDDLMQLSAELIRLDECEKAIPFLTKAIKYRPNASIYYRERRKCYAKMEKWTEAYSDSKTLWKLRSFGGYFIDLRHVELLKLCKFLMDKQKFYNEAVLCFTEAIEKNPQEYSCYKLRGDCYKNMENYDLAESDYREVLAKNAKDKESRISLIRVLVIAGKSEEAAAEMRFLNDVELGKLGDDFCEHEGKFNAAIQCFTEASNQSHLDPEYNLKRGICYEKMNDLGEAINDFKKALQKKPNDELILEKLILALFKTQRMDEATKILHSLSDDKLKCLGKRFFEAEKFDNAISAYNEAIEKNSDDGLNYNSRGSCYLAMGNLHSAMTDFQRAIKLAPSDTSCLFNWITVLFKIGRSTEALEKLSNLDEPKLISMGNALLEEGKSIEALQCFTEAIQKNSNNSSSHEKAGTCYWMNGDFELAKLEMEKAINLLQPNDQHRIDLEIMWCERLVEAEKFSEAKFALKNLEVTHGKDGIPVELSDKIVEIRDKMTEKEQKKMKT